MDTPFKLFLVIAFVITGFSLFGVLMGNQNDIDNSGYIIPTNESYDSLGVFSDLSIFDYIGGITNITTGNDSIDTFITVFFSVAIALGILFYARGTQ